MAAYTYDEHLESKRLRTRKFMPADAEVWTTFCADAESIEFFPLLKSETPKEAAAKWVQSQLERYAQNRYGLQALILKDTGEFIGMCGLLTQEVEGKQELEVGYHVLRKHWGHGYAPEAAKLFIDYAFGTGQANSVISIIDVGNVKSQRVAGKNNLGLEKRVLWKDLDVYIYRIYSEEISFKS